MATTSAPSPYAVVEDKNLISPGIRAFVLTLTGISILATLFVIAWLWLHRKDRIVVSHQPIFLYIICVGLLIWMCSVIPLSLDDGIVSARGCDIACIAYDWLATIGFTVTFAGLFSKLWRINRVFRSPQFRRVSVQAKDVMIPFFILFSFNCTMLILLTVLDPPTWVRQPVYPEDENYTYGSCKVQGIGDLFLKLLGISEIIAIIAVIYQAYRARNISADFSETWPLAIIFFNWIQLIIIGSPTLTLIEKILPTASFYLASVLILAQCDSLLLAIYCPLYYHHSIRNPPPAMGAQIRVTGLQHTRATVLTESMADLGDSPRVLEDIAETDVDRSAADAVAINGNAASVFRKEESIES